MEGKLGYFTCYGIEDVYFDFIGKEKIDQIIKDTKENNGINPTLYDFAYGNPEYSFVFGKGVFWVFSKLLTDYFIDDLGLAERLYRTSKKYNWSNYFSGGLLPSKWGQYLKRVDTKTKNNPSRIHSIERTIANPFWIEYHYFMEKYFELMLKHYKTLLENGQIGKGEGLWFLEKAFSEYNFNSEKITERFSIDERYWYENRVTSFAYKTMIDFYELKGDLKEIKRIKRRADEQGWKV